MTHTTAQERRPLGGVFFRLDYEAAIQAMEQAFDCYAHYQDDGEAMQFNEKLYGLAEERLQSWKKIVECMGKLRVSACVIAKNERENIKKWLCFKAL